jgi:hypothetical protein
VIVLGILLLLVSSFLLIAGLLGIFADRLGLVASSGLTADALSSGGIFFLVLAIVLAIAGAGMMWRRPWGWWLAVATAVVSILWTLVRILEVPAFVHIEWYLALVLAAVFLGYLSAVHRFFRPLDLE